MEVLKRKIKCEREEDHNNMNCSIINGVRLSLRWADVENPKKDVIINFTMRETEKIKEILK